MRNWYSCLSTQNLRCLQILTLRTKLFLTEFWTLTKVMPASPAHNGSVFVAFWGWWGRNNVLAQTVQIFFPSYRQSYKRWPKAGHRDYFVWSTEALWHLKPMVSILKMMPRVEAIDSPSSFFSFSSWHLCCSLDINRELGYLDASLFNFLFLECKHHLHPGITWLYATDS